jgi:hypothetical protein
MTSVYKPRLVQPIIAVADSFAMADAEDRA